MAAVVIRLTNGLVLSIDKLCSFSNDIGNGIFKPKMLNLKETELSGLETNMNHMAKKLSEYDAEQKTFFQNVSHELKTPLMSIQGYAEGISAKLFKSQKVIEAADIILEENMIVSCEPGIYIYGYGGVRIEDLVCVKNDGIRNLTNLSKELIEI